jgi:hypothetical protein
LSAIHISLGGLFVGAIEVREVWFVASGVAMAATGAINLLRARNRSHRPTAAVAALLSASLFALVACYGVASGDWHSFEVVAQFALYALLFWFSLADLFRQRPRPAN